MSNLILLFVCLIFGILMQKIKALPKDTHVSINVLILYVSLPALILLSIPTLQLDVSLISLCLLAWIIFGLAYFFFSYLGKKMQWDQAVIGCLILTAGLGNTSFVGFPVVEALYGKEALKYAVLIDQPGTFLVCSSFGLWVANVFAQGKIRKRELLGRVLIFPPFIAFCLGLAMSLMNMEAAGLPRTLLQRLADMLTPLALISVGLQLRPKDMLQDWRALSWGLGFKLIIAPICIYVIYRLANVPQDIFKVAVLESAMAPMITASIIAASYGLQPRLAGLMVGVGVPLSLVTLSAWYFLL